MKNAIEEEQAIPYQTSEHAHTRKPGRKKKHMHQASCQQQQLTNGVEEL